MTRLLIALLLAGCLSCSVIGPKRFVYQAGPKYEKIQREAIEAGLQEGDSTGYVAWDIINEGRTSKLIYAGHSEAMVYEGTRYPSVTVIWPCLQQEDGSRAYVSKTFMTNAIVGWYVDHTYKAEPVCP